MLETQISPPNSRHPLRIPVILCAALLTAGCDEISRRIQQAVEPPPAKTIQPPPPPDTAVKLYSDMAAEAIQRSVACLESTGVFTTVPCDKLGIKFEDDIGRKFDAAKEIKEHRNPTCMALSGKRDKHRKLRTQDHANVRDAEVIFWADVLGPTHGIAGSDFATKAVKGNGPKRWTVYYARHPGIVIDTVDLLKDTRTKVEDLFEGGSVDLSQPACTISNP